jgi:hypothetical protein
LSPAFQNRFYCELLEMHVPEIVRLPQT